MARSYTSFINNAFNGCLRRLQILTLVFIQEVLLTRSNKSTCYILCLLNYDNLALPIMNKKSIGFYTAISLVVANMIGTGVFTSLGFQLMGIQSPAAILFLWILGGILAFCGALVYGELGSAYPHSGGEYIYLSKLYHPSIGFASGFVSSLIGFAAPVALSAMAFAGYLKGVIPDLPSVKIIASGLIILITSLHALHVKNGARFQVAFTSLKILVIAAFILFGLKNSSEIAFSLDAAFFSDLKSTSFAVSMIYVSYAYSGWNAASYIASEMDSPQKNLPKALLQGTALVTVLYVLLNLVFMLSTPLPDLKGVMEVGLKSATNVFGIAGGNIMGTLISLLLISSVSSMIIAGPRVSAAMGESSPSLSFLAVKNKNQSPYVAILLQSLISVLLILTSSFETIITYTGFTLCLFTLLTATGVLLFRKSYLPSPFKIPFFPIPLLLFIALNGWILCYVLLDKPLESVFGLSTALAGILVWFIISKTK